jgi:hypothetical protein
VTPSRAATRRLLTSTRTWDAGSARPMRNTELRIAFQVAEGSPRRLRIGLLVPSTNSRAEPDFHRSVSENMTVHSHRLWHGPTYDTEAAMDRLNSQLEDADRRLATAVIDIICMARTANSFTQPPW